MTARHTLVPLLAAALAACGGGNATSDSVGATGAATGAVTTPGAGMTTGSVTGATASAAGASTGATTASAGALLDPNTAPREQLATLPGMTPALADSLVAKRPFKDMRDVDRVLRSLSEQQRDTLYARMFLPLDLNKATAEELELIPGVGRRMRHEFEEYRPYKDIGQFRREIGKYVDEQEVARLEKYVRIGG